MSRTVYNTILGIIAVALIFAFAGCASAGDTTPGSIVIKADGEEVTEITVLNGTEAPELTVEVEPENCTEELVWESSDAGVVRVSEADGLSCRLSILKSGTAKITVCCGNASRSIKVSVMKNQDCLSEMETAYYLNDKRYSAEMMNLYFVDAYVSFRDYYGDYLDYIGLDPDANLADLAEQSCDYSTDGTWKGYFLETACDDLLNTTALCDWAGIHDVTLDEEELLTIRNEIEKLTNTAVENGYSDLDAYLEEHFGTGITTEIYENYLSEVALAEKAYNMYYESLTYTDETLDAYCSEVGYEGEEYDDPTVSMRHILIMAETDENGECSEEAISEAHEKACQIHEEWLAGDGTEESFAELAAAYSEDSASAEDGGLYEDIASGELVDGIDEWLFSDGREAGDSSVIDNNGSYVGTHVVLFVGTGETYGHVLARSELEESDLSEWLNDLTDSYTVKEGRDYNSIGDLSYIPN